MAAEANNFQTPCVPKFDGDYDYWSLVMKNLLRSKEYWIVIEAGYEAPQVGEQLTAAQQKTLEEMKLKDLKVRNYLFQAIDKHILKTITQKETAKQLWDSMRVKYQGNARVKRAQLQRLRRDFEILEIKTGETVTDYFGRVMIVANDMRNYGEDMNDVKIVEKILRTLTDSFNYVVCSIEESKDLDTLTVDELQSSLLVHEQKVRRKDSKDGEDQVLKVEHDSNGGRGRGRQSFGRGNYRRRGRGRSRPNLDKSTIECYRCHKYGHFAYECPEIERAANYVEYEENEDLLLMAYAEKHEDHKMGIWFLDSGCSNHMTGVKEWFVKLDESFVHTVKLGNNSRLAVTGKSDIRVEVEGVIQVITDVYLVPELTTNLLSIGQLQEKGVTLVIKAGVCKIYHPQRGLIISSRITGNRMFIVSAAVKPFPKRCLQTDVENVAQTVWASELQSCQDNAL